MLRWSKEASSRHSAYTALVSTVTFLTATSRPPHTARKTVPNEPRLQPDANWCESGQRGD